jgi:HK97 family phage major capsid protein
LSWAYNDDTAAVGVLLGQNTAVANSSLTYSKKVIGCYDFSSQVFPVSLQLIQDSQIDISSMVGEALGVRLGRVSNTYFTTGTGASQPDGFMNDASAGVTAGSSTVLAYSDLVKLKYCFDYAYLNDPSFRFTMSLSTFSKLQLLVDDNQRPLFWNQQANLASGSPLTLLDVPIVINNDMPAATTGLKPICGIVGNKFIIRQVKDIQIMTLKERYLDTLSVGFLAYMRADCKLLNDNCAKVLTMA